jgi:hypothetical protein
VEAVVGWKSNRSVGYFRRNKDHKQLEATVALALRSRDPQEALDTLTQLHGVKERVASAILATFRPDDYTVMDINAWKALRAHGLLEKQVGTSWRATWVPYLEECRRIAVRSHGA